jgi:hypothetical protein
VGCLERRVADGGADGGEETVGCVAHAQVAGNRGGGGAVRGVDGALCCVWRPRGAARAVRAAKACMVGAGATCRKVSSAEASGRARSIAATSSSGPCRVMANSSGPRGSPCRIPICEETTAPGDWWTMRWLCRQ